MFNKTALIKGFIFHFEKFVPSIDGDSINEDSIDGDSIDGDRTSHLSNTGQVLCRLNYLGCPLSRIRRAIE